MAYSPRYREAISKAMAQEKPRFSIRHASTATLLSRSQVGALDAVNKELEAFSYSVSHDLRAPLRSIDGFSQALIDEYAEHLDDTAADYLRRIRAATQRMGHLIDDLLDLSRVTRREMREEEVDLSALATISDLVGRGA